ncbi:STAS domain-containing protein [Actinomadura fulvescens]|uniref:Anti-sigma factor antagonist n=1 Tax=Actinomadura fulvescens TaxID=46160 RepID=A0ABN3QWH9_9ACTN
MTTPSGAAPLNPPPAGGRARRPWQPQPLLTITSGRHGQWYTLILNGELDVASAPDLQSALDHPLATMAPPYVALDLAALSFCDSSGLNTILRGWRGAAREGGELILLRPHARVTALLRLTGLDQRLTVAPHLNEPSG